MGRVICSLARAATLAALLSAFTAPARLGAQGQLVLRADSLAAAGDTARALVLLDSAVLLDRGDAAAWDRRGVLAWELARSGRTGLGVARQSEDSLLRVADISLRRATRRGADASYLVDFGRFLLGSNFALVRARARGYFERALKAARRSKDMRTASRAADELGMGSWRTYETLADRHVYSSTKDPTDESLINDPGAIQYFVDNIARRAAAQEWSGERDFATALDYFTSARTLDADNPRALRHFFMALADRQRWEELRQAARTRLGQNPRDAWAWLGRGLASHRLHDEREATVAFDSALALLPPQDRARFDRLPRILRPRDSIGISELTPVERAVTEKLYWLMVDPLWVTPPNEHRLEFLSRVAYAELRWTVEEFGLHGADSDMGDMYIRYGPAPAVISFSPDPIDKHEHRVRILWWYREGVAFLFRLLPGYGVAELEVDDVGRVKRMRDTIPVVWTNVGVEQSVDTIAVQTARFRAPGDSADVFVAANIPVDGIARGLDLASGALHVDFQAYNWRAQQVARNSTRERVDFTQPQQVRTRAWRERMGSGPVLFRVEALAPAALRGARASNRLELGGGSGFGMSDLLVAERVTPKDGGAERWSDFSIVPNVGRVKRGQPFALLWETYALGAERGESKYRVTIDLKRRGPSGFGRLMAAVVGGVRSAVGLRASGDDHVTLRYDREVPARPVLADYLSLDLGTAPAGVYVLSVQITDLATSRQTTRETTIAVDE